MPSDVPVKPRATVSRSQIVSRRGGSAADEVIIIDDLSSPEDEVPPAKVSDSGDNKQMSLEPDAKKPKLESPDVGAADQPAPIVDDAMLSSIPMPSQLPSLLDVAAEVQCSPVMAEGKVSVSPVLATVSQEQHSMQTDEQKTSPGVGQNVASSDASYAFKRLTELPMPPAATDDECDSPSEHSR